MLSRSAPPPLAGAVLAGGHSRRMGRDKALLPFRGVPMVRIMVDRLAGLTRPVAVIADRANRYAGLGVPILGDLHQGCGPLGGIHAALRQLRSAEVFVLACDTPFVSEELIAYIAAFPTAAPARVATMDGSLHPLCGVYSQACLPAIEEAISAQHFALRTLLNTVGAASVPLTPDLPFFHPRLLWNVNDPAALAELESGDR